MGTSLNCSHNTVVIGFEKTTFTVDESAGIVNVSVSVLDGLDVLTTGVLSNVILKLISQDDTATGK